MSVELDEFSSFRDDDPIARLIVHYFYPCDHMRDCLKKVREAQKSKMTSEPETSIHELNFLKLWLGTLYAVAEGFQELKLQDDTVAAFVGDENFQNLRRFRNGSFHYQRNPEKLVQFFRGHEHRENWAEALHESLDKYFSDYRINMTVDRILKKTKPERTG